MNGINQHLKPYLLGGVSLSLLAIAVLNTQYLQNEVPLSNEEWLTESVDPRIANLIVHPPTEAESEGAASLHGQDAATQPDEAASPVEETPRQKSKFAGDKIVNERKRILEYSIAGHDTVDAEQRRTELTGRSSSETKILQAQNPYDREPAIDLVIERFGAPNPSEAVFEQYAPSAPPATAGAIAGKKDAARASRTPNFELNRLPSTATNRSAFPMSDQPIIRNYQDQGRDKFSDIESSATKLVAEDPMSTFSIDVDTASYTLFARRLTTMCCPNDTPHASKK
ncbi:MAG: hypothetical protein ACI8XZ_002065 [Gammaproteobacteria bacterium]|jgi:hypothetical protein